MGNMEEIVALPTIGASQSTNAVNSLVPVTSCRDLRVLTTTEYEPSNERDGAKNTTSLLLESKNVTVAETGTDDREETKEMEMSEATTARRLEQNSVIEVPPTVEMTEGDTKSMDGIGSTLGSKQ